MSTILPVLSDSVLATCRTYWKKGRNGRGLADDCCKGCPLMGPCFSACAPTADGLAAHTEKMNATAERLASQVVRDVR